MRLGYLSGYEISQLLHHMQQPDINDSISTKKTDLEFRLRAFFKVFVFYTFFPVKKTASVSKKLASGKP